MKFLSQKVVYLTLMAIFVHVRGMVEQTIGSSIQKENADRIPPSVMIVMLVRNKEHTLPWFLAGIERLKYPKRRIALWIRSDHNEDGTAAMLEKWVSRVRTAYHSVDMEIEAEPTKFPNQKTTGHWSKERVDHIIALREEGLNVARTRWADYVFFIDADNILLNQNTLQSLIEQERVLVAPMLNCTDAPLYSNFWGGMSDEGFYQRTREYIDIIQRTKKGLYRVPIVHSVFLIDLNHKLSSKLSFLPHPDYKMAHDDLIIWVQSTLYSGVPVHILNSEFFGYINSASREEATLFTERGWFSYLKMQAAIEMDIVSIPVSPFIKPNYPTKSKLGIDQIYVINLLRRETRHAKMKNCLDEIGIDAKFVEAVDGRQLNETYLENLGVMMMPDYIDRYHKRPLTMGEIGCFLSHYKLWQEMVDNDYETIIVFEDDVKFESFFPWKLSIIRSEAKQAVPDWDLIYLGRKIMFSRSEIFVDGVKNLVRPYYTYWTIGYMLSLSGAKKLLAQKPLEKMVPVDEYLPIMFDHHPLDSWKSHFSPRDLVALSAEPRLVHPTYYTGMEHYVTDTEDTEVYTKFAESKVERIYQTIAEGEERYVQDIRERTERFLKANCDAGGGCQDYHGEGEDEGEGLG